jgi:hypothetical protein
MGGWVGEKDTERFDKTGGDDCPQGMEMREESKTSQNTLLNLKVNSMVRGTLNG